VRFLRRRDQEGSLTVELVVLTPVLLFLALVIVAFGRESGARQQVTEAARAGAESAAVLPSAASAQAGAAAAAVTGLVGHPDMCAHVSVDTDLLHFFPGGFVTVTVSCTVDLSDLTLPGISGETTVSATATAPIDPYRSVA
jgi:Flp pilus assembly protein TadG